MHSNLACKSAGFVTSKLRTPTSDNLPASYLASDHFYYDLEHGAKVGTDEPHTMPAHSEWGHDGSIVWHSLMREKLKAVFNRIATLSLPNALDILAIECHSDVISSSAIMAFHFMNALLLRRVQLKYPPTCTKILEMLNSETPLTTSVSDVSLIRANRPQQDIAATVGLFPNLISLYAEFLDGS